MSQEQPESQEGPLPQLNAKSAEQIYDTIRMLWNDRIELAASMKERRRLYATVLAATGAIGIIRVAWTRPATEVTIFPCATSEYLVKSLVVLGIGFLGWACLYIFREGSVVGTTAEETEPTGPTAVNSDWSIQPPVPPPLASNPVSARSISRIDIPEEDEREALATLPPERLWLIRAADLRAAHTQLVVDNNEVKGRLRSGLSRFGFGYSLIAVALVLYTLVSSRGPLPMPQQPTKTTKTKVSEVAARRIAAANRVAMQYTQIAAQQAKAQQLSPLARIKAKIAL